ncbi:MAG: DHH family phosphoesterase [Acidobacteriota bacterium]
MTETTRPPEPLLERLRAARSVVLTSHINPDGDAIGSELALARLLEQMGCRSAIWNRDEMPRPYRALPGAEAIHVGTEPPPGFPDDFDTAVVLECPSLERCGVPDAMSALPMINIDHHLGNTEYGVVRWIDPEAPAVGEMLLTLAGALGLTLDADTADCLYLALSTDTGGFRFSNATPRAFDAASAMVRAGARPERVSHWVYESQTEANLRLVGEMLRGLTLHADGHIATVWLTRHMMERAGAGPGDSEGLVDYPRSIAGVEAVALFRELEDGGVKASLRSRGVADVESIARSFGGGGHHNAAGFTVAAEARDGLEARTVAALDAALEAAR